MASFNQATIVGNVGRDPEMRYSPSGQPRTEFSVATSRSWKKDEQWQEETTWHNVVVWGQRAERAAEQIRKGMQVLVVGRIENRSWDDDKNPGQKKYRSEIVADTVHRLGRKDENEQGGFVAPVEGFGSPVAAKPSGSGDPYEDLPF